VRDSPPQLVHPTSFPSAPTFGSSILVKNGGTLFNGESLVSSENKRESESEDVLLLRLHQEVFEIE